MQLLLLYSIFVLTISIPVITIQFNSVTKLNHDTIDISPYFESVDIICSWVHPHKQDDLFHSILQNIVRTKKSFITTTHLDNTYTGCEGFLVSNVDIGSICKYLKHKNTLFLPSVIFVILDQLPFENSEECFDHFDWANVFLIKFAHSDFYILSRPLVSARYFERSRFTARPSLLHDHIYDLQGRNVRVATFHLPPFTVVHQKADSAWDAKVQSVLTVEYSGMEFLLFKELASYLNCTWEVVELKEPRNWGFLLENKTVIGGVAQAITDGEADIAFSNMWQRLMFYRTMDFGPTLSKLYLTFLVRRPHIVHNRWKMLFAIMQKEVWLATLGAIVSVSITLWVIRRLLNKSHGTSLIESTMMVFGIFTITSSHVGCCRGVADRLLIHWWNMFTLVFLTAVTGSIVTSLTVPVFTSRVDTVRQLVEKNYYWTDPGYAKRKSFLKTYTFDLSDPWQAKFESRYKYIPVRNLAKALKTEKKITIPAQRWRQHYVVIGVQGVEPTTDLSQFRAMQQVALKQLFTSINFRKKSPLNLMFHRGLNHLIEFGFWYHWMKNTTYQYKDRKELLVEKDLRVLLQPEPLNLLKLHSIFSLLLIGLILSSLLFAIEVFMYGSFKKNKNIQK